MLRKAAKGVAVMGAAAAGLGIAMGVKAVSKAVEFEKLMARIQGLAGASAAQTKAWADQLISLGPQLGKSPIELANALYFVASSGVPASKAISVIAASAKAAAAGLGETEVVADAVTSVMNAYASAGMTAARATSVLVNMVKEGKGEADAFAGVIGNVAAFASRLKVPFEQVGAALAAMTQLGTDPRVAATQLQAFFSQVLKVTGKMKKAAKEMGLGDFIANLQETLTKGDLLGALRLVKRELGRDPLGMAQMFPNVRALRALLALTAQDGGKVEGVFRRMTDSSGALGTAWGAAQQTAALNMERFRASIESLQIAFGQGLLPMVTEVAKALSRRLADPEFVERIRDIGEAVGTTLLNALHAVGAWINANWPGIQRGFQTTWSIIQDLGTATQALLEIWRKAGPVFFRIIQNAMIRPMKISWAIISGILGALEGAAGWVPGVGGKIRAAREAVDKGREKIRSVEAGLNSFYGGQGGKKRTPGTVREAPGALRPRARGGPVMPGVAYRVGERGQETFVPASAGSVWPNGGGGVYIANVHLPGVTNPRQFLTELQRIARSSATSRTGRYGGSNLALS